MQQISEKRKELEKDFWNILVDESVLYMCS